MDTTTFSAPDISCGGCANAIKKALGGVAGIDRVDVDVDAKTVTVAHDPDLASAAAVLTRLDHAGFPATIQA